MYDSICVFTLLPKLIWIVITRKLFSWSNIEVVAMVQHILKYSDELRKHLMEMQKLVKNRSLIYLCFTPALFIYKTFQHLTYYNLRQENSQKASCKYWYKLITVKFEMFSTQNLSKNKQYGWSLFLSFIVSCMLNENMPTPWPNCLKCERSLIRGQPT